jgi:pyruvate dehydrogenase E2 component (dihydrolipoamide acetyltransferase)
MASLEFKLPDIGEGVHEGEVVKWYVAPGDRVAEDDPMVEVMTDKATVTIGAPREGVIERLCHEVGSVARVGEVLLVIAAEGAGARASAPAAEPKAKEAVATAVGDIREGLPGAAFFQSGRKPQNGGRHHAGPARAAHYVEKPLATPATRKLARDLDVDLRRVPPSGKGGRVTKDDVEAFARGGAPAPAGEERGADALRPAQREVRVPFVGLRRRIAERMQTSKRTAAHFTFVEECDAGRLVALREALAPEAAQRGAKLSFLPFVVMAVVRALREHPMLNAYLDEAHGEIVLRAEHHIGVATATEAGLVVPVIRDAGALGLFRIAREIERLAAGARAGTLRPGELSGSTFTITSLGRRSGLLATPVLNHPEVGILGVHRVKKKPVVKDDRIVIGEVMNLSLSFDHRVVDGHVGAAFAYAIIEHLERPERLFAERLE